MSELSFFDRVHKNDKHTPDVLSCLANLSNDEVFTPPEIVNNMLDMLPQELFSDPNARFLDPACKTGVFLREIAKRLLIGLEPIFPDLQERIDHIFHNQLYGIAITELTSLLSRRSLYCSKYPNGPYSISKFDNPEGNIRFKKISHTWDGKQCLYCGASKEEYDRDKSMESHAYEFIHLIDMEEAKKVGFFDVIISNPPYQLSDGGGTGDSAKSIYHLFIEQAKKLNPNFISMITPSRWFKGGKGLDAFRESMMGDLSIKEIHDYENAQECFPGVHIDGGINYFLWQKDYSGPVKYVYKPKDSYEIEATRYLKTDITNTIIRDHRQITIIEKVKKNTEHFFNEIVSPRKPWGIATDLFNQPDNYPQGVCVDTPKNGYIKIYGVKGKKGGAKRVSGYIKQSYIKQNIEEINKYKILFSYAYSTDATVPPKPIIAKPGEISTETFLRIGPFDTQIEAENCLSYIQTKFFRALLYFNRIQKNASQKTFELIPLLDMRTPWTDEKLYEQYGFTNEEIDFIEDMIAPMNVNEEVK